MFKPVMTSIFLLLPVLVHAEPTASDCDFNNNGKVDFADFVAFSQGYNTNQTQFDLNGDGAVNFRDFAIFGQFYGDETTPIGIQVGMQAPDFKVKTLTGESFNLYKQRGKPVFLNFWRTWCGACVVEMPNIQKLQNTMGDSIQIVGVDIRESRSTVQSFVARNGYTYTFVLDPLGHVSWAYRVPGTPNSVFLDAKGVIVRKFLGSQNYQTLLKATRLAIGN